MNTTSPRSARQTACLGNCDVGHAPTSNAHQRGQNRRQSPIIMLFPDGRCQSLTGITNDMVRGEPIFAEVADKG